MFHTFESSQLADAAHLNGNGRNGPATETKTASSRRTSTVRACEPCRKRKIRCNGELPCETCQWYRKANSCHYTEPRQRQVPSRKSIEQITSTLQDYRTILQQLFPSMHPESLVNLPREKLLELISKTGANQPPSPATSGSGVVETSSISPNAEAGGLETLQLMPEETSDSSYNSQTNPGIVDEVNALSLSVKVSSSYQGISSVMAVLRVILWIYPESQTFFANSPDRTAMSSRCHSPPPQIDMSRWKEGNYNSRDTLPLLNSYFNYVHPLIPLIEEQSFRETYITGNRHDSRWLALLNMVFAMGSVAASDAEDKTHYIFFERAKQHLGGFECLGSAHLETVQTLAIMGGLYLHYLQQPNLANSVMGSCLRMATALGLHREYVDARPKPAIINPAFSIDMRRRVWWSVFILDSWANMTLGRPSLGRWGSAITARPPLSLDDRGQGAATLCLIENIAFCKIATQIEDALAITPLVPYPEMVALDNALVDWFNRLPSALQPTETQGIPENIISTRTIMRWRYQITRLVLHRPVLLNYAIRRIHLSQLRQEEREAIERCRNVARELIEDIANNTHPNQMCGWNGLWFAYQAVMVPLLSLFTDPRDPDNVRSSSISVELALQAMDQITRYSPTGNRTIDATSRIYEASKRLTAETRSIAEKNPRVSTSARMQKSGQKPSMQSPTMVTPSSELSPRQIHPSTSSPQSMAQNFSTNSDLSILSISPTSSFYQSHNPSNLPPSGSGASDMDIQTMWDSLNWSNGWDTFDFPLSGVWDNGMNPTFDNPEAGEQQQIGTGTGFWGVLGGLQGMENENGSNWT